MAKILIDGEEYELSFDFDIGEARVIKRMAGVTLKELETHDESDPDLVAAFIFIAFKRRYPDTPDSVLEQRVNAVKLASIDMRDQEVMQDPPAPTLVSDSSESSSGATSENGAAATSGTESLATTGPPH